MHFLSYLLELKHVLFFFVGRSIIYEVFLEVHDSVRDFCNLVTVCTDKCNCIFQQQAVINLNIVPVEFPFAESLRDL